MSSHLVHDIEYEIFSDQSSLNPSKYIKTENIYNLLLIPKISEYNKFFGLQPTDVIKFVSNNKNFSQKIAINCGDILLNSKEYFYFYICPGFKSFNKNILLEQYSLYTTLQNNNNIKILKGLIVLPNNFNYLIDKNIGIYVNVDEHNHDCEIRSISNYFNYYMPNQYNTTIDILADNNYKLLQKINNSHQSIYIKSKYIKGFPPGSINIKLPNNSVSNIRISGLDNSLDKNFLAKDSIKIDNLFYGKYLVKINDKEFTFDIPRLASNITSVKSKPLKKPQFIKPPDKNKANLVLNLRTSPLSLHMTNNSIKQFDLGYHVLYNIDSGKYKIEYSTETKDIFIIKNQNNYISN